MQMYNTLTFIQRDVNRRKKNNELKQNVLVVDEWVRSMGQYQQFQPVKQMLLHSIHSLVTSMELYVCVSGVAIFPGTSIPFSSIIDMLFICCCFIESINEIYALLLCIQTSNEFLPIKFKQKNKAPHTNQVESMRHWLNNNWMWNMDTLWHTQSAT